MKVEKKTTEGRKKTTEVSRNSISIYVQFQITVACGLKFHWYLRTLSLKSQKARTKIEGQRRENFNFACSLPKF